MEDTTGFTIPSITIQGYDDNDTLFLNEWWTLLKELQNVNFATFELAMSIVKRHEARERSDGTYRKLSAKEMAEDYLKVIEHFSEEGWFEKSATLTEACSNVATQLEEIVVIESNGTLTIHKTGKDLGDQLYESLKEDGEWVDESEKD